MTTSGINNTSSSSSNGGGKERRKSYTCHFKLEVVDFAEKYTNGRAADHYNVHRRRVQEWRNQKPKLVDQIKQSKGDTKRLSGGGRKHDSLLTLNKLKDRMAVWIRNRLEVGVRVTPKTIYEEAYRFNHNVSMKWADKLLEDVELDMLEQGLENNEHVYVTPERDEMIRDDVMRTEAIRHDVMRNDYVRDRDVIVPHERYYTKEEKRDAILRAFKIKTYSIHDWLDGKTDDDMQY